MKKLSLLLCVSAASLSLTACSDNSNQTTPEKAKPAKVVVVGQAVSSAARSFTGVVEASRSVQLAFQVPGRIIKLPVLEGDDLQKGQVVAKLDPREYDYQLNQAKAKYKYEAAQVERLGSLVKKGFVSRSHYDKAESDYSIAKANYQQAQKDLADTTLKAPYVGMVVKKFVKEQEEVQAKQPVVSFQDITEVDVKANIPENVIATVKRGSSPKVMASFIAAPGREFAMKVKEFSAEADPETQTYTAVFTMPAPKEVNILPGMSAKVMLHFKQAGNPKTYFLLPSGSILTDAKGQSFVWRLDPSSNQVHKTEVTVAGLKGGSAEVTKGLQQGETVIAAGVHFLREGQKVRPIKGDAL